MQTVISTDIFCPQCGTKVPGGNFCMKCGSSLPKFSQEGRSVAAVPLPAEPPILEDWDHEIRYARLIQHPPIRELITKHAQMAPKRVSSQELFALFDQANPKAEVKMEKLAPVMQAIGDAVGVIVKSKPITTSLPRPTGAVMIALLCALARSGYRMERVQQEEAGCVFFAQIPPDMWSLGGLLIFRVCRAPGGTLVEASANLKGQLLDMGRSRRLLGPILRDLPFSPA